MPEIIKESPDEKNAKQTEKKENKKISEQESKDATIDKKYENIALQEKKALLQKLETKFEDVKRKFIDDLKKTSEY